MNIFKRSAIAGLLVLSLVACGDSKEKKAAYIAQVTNTMMTMGTKAMTDSASVMSLAAKGEEGKKEALAKLDTVIKDLQANLDSINKLDVPKDAEQVQKELKELLELIIKNMKEDRNTLEKEGFAKLMDPAIAQKRMADSLKIGESLGKQLAEFTKKAELSADDLKKAMENVKK